MKCVTDAGSNSVTVMIMASGGSVWLSCPLGTSITPPGYQGQIICPAASDICNDELREGNAVAESVSTTAAPAPPPTTGSATNATSASSGAGLNDTQQSSAVAGPYTADVFAADVRRFFSSTENIIIFVVVVFVVVVLIVVVICCCLRGKKMRVLGILFYDVANPQQLFPNGSAGTTLAVRGGGGSDDLFSGGSAAPPPLEIRAAYEAPIPDTSAGGCCAAAPDVIAENGKVIKATTEEDGTTS